MVILDDFRLSRVLRDTDGPKSRVFDDICSHKHLSNHSCVQADAEGSLQEKRICLLTAMQRLGTLTLGHFGLLWHKLSYGSGTPKQDKYTYIVIYNII